MSTRLTFILINRLRLQSPVQFPVVMYSLGKSHIEPDVLDAHHSSSFLPKDNMYAHISNCIVVSGIANL